MGAIDAKAFLTSLVFNFAVGTFLLLVFSILRIVPTFKKFYQSKRFVPHEERALPKPLTNGLLGWILPLYRYTEREIINTAGMDAVMNLRLLSFGFRLFFILSILSCAIILPINISGGVIQTIEKSGGDISGQNNTGQADSQSVNCSTEAASLHETFTNMSLVSLTNIPAGHNKLWAHLVMVYVVSYIVYSLLLKYHKHSVLLRLTYLAGASPGAESHTVLITDIPGIQFGTKLYRFYEMITGCFGICCPGSLKQRIRTRLTESTDAALSIIGNTFSDQSTEAENLLDAGHSTAIVLDPWKKTRQQIRRGQTVKEVVEQEFKDIFGDQVEGANPVYNCQLLWKLYWQLINLQANIQDFTDVCKLQAENNGKINNLYIKVVPKLHGGWCVSKYGTSLKPVRVSAVDFWMAKLQEVFKQYQEEKQKALCENTATSFVTFNVRVAQTISATAFLQHDECLWRASQAPSPDDLIWGNLMYRLWERNWRTLIAWVLYLLMIAFYAIPVAFIQALIGQYFTTDKIEIEFLRNILKGIIPGLALKIFLILVPYIIAFLNFFSGVVSQSGVDFGVVQKYYYFQVLVVYLYTLGFSYFFEELNCLLSHPTGIVNKLAAQVPSNATYFMTYILILGFFSFPLAFVNIPKLLMTTFFSIFKNTERKKLRVWKSTPMRYGPIIPDQTIVILIGLCFCVVQPLITPICFLYYFVVDLLSRYQFIYMKGEKYQSGGLMWPVVFDQVLFGLFVMQLTMLGLLGMKRFVYSPLIIPLLIVTVIYKLNVDYLYKRPLQIMSLRAAADLDRVGSEHIVGDAYLAPCFKFDKSEVDDLMEELHKCKQLGQKELSGFSIDTSEQYYDC